MSNFLRCAMLFAACASVAVADSTFHSARASSGYATLYAFCQQTGCADGKFPDGELISDSAGNLYGVTSSGGMYNNGAVFEVTAAGVESVLYSFCAQPNCVDGSYPSGSLTRDAAGNLYGTTESGGANGQDAGTSGTVFKLAPDGTETVLYSFCSQPSCADGAYPASGVILDHGGNIYGTTYEGGSNTNQHCPNYAGCGTVFEIAAASGKESVIYSFCQFLNCPDGTFPAGGLVRDKSGNMFGVTGAGGNGFNIGEYGAAYEIAANGLESVLYSFCSHYSGGICTDGGSPNGRLIEDASGNLYGTTETGGIAGPCGSQGCGTIFELSQGGSEAVLYAFCAQVSGSTCLDGAVPAARLLGTRHNTIFCGTTVSGGSNNAGTVFRFGGDGETVLHSFGSAEDENATHPTAGLIMHKGHFWGTVGSGGSGAGGVAFKLGIRGGDR
jgi:uncharacterized repeat protein (TIGR03803 family)